MNINVQYLIYTFLKTFLIVRIVLKTDYFLHYFMMSVSETSRISKTNKRVLSKRDIAYNMITDSKMKGITYNNIHSRTVAFNKLN